MKTLLLISLVAITNFVFPQKFDWVNFYQGQSVQQLVSVSTDKSGNVYHSINFLNEIKMDTFIRQGSTSGWRSFVGKLDSSGKMLWYRIARAIGNYNATTLSSTFNSSGNLIVFIACQTNLVLGNDTIVKVGGSSIATYILEIDRQGNLVHGRQLLEGNLTTINYISKNFCNDDKDNLYISIRMSSSVKVYDTASVTSLGSTSGNYIFKFSKSGRLFEWNRILPNSIITNNIDVDIHGNLYLSAYWEASPNSFTFNSQNITKPQTTSGCVFIFDKNGNDRNWFYIPSSSGESTVHGVVANDSNSLFVTGYFKGDSAKFGNKWKKVKAPGAYYFVSKFNINGQSAWVRTEDTAFSSMYNKHDDYGSITKFSSQFVYVSYLTYAQYGRVVYDGISYHANGLKWGMNLKVDELGNILWGFRTFYPFSAMQTDQYSNLYFGSWFETDSVFYGSFKAKGDQGDALIGKTFDYAIFRGLVKPGPYCAGDTFIVPYRKLGEFADSNIFYAELSDENGDFNGGERILGSKATKDSGTIVGNLPLFQVNSSGKYRIRIRSTAPQTQSFYKLDTLRLQVYSKDKADPGPPIKICLGDTVRIQTYGGTKWTWSPKYRMSDSTIHNPFVWPTKTTDYEIIIDDSSGCGQADTAIKKVIVRKEPTIEFLTKKDTVVCMGSTVPVVAAFHYGDSLGYSWDWISVDKNGSQTYLKSGSGKLKDTIQYKMPPSEKDSMQLLLFLRDGCSPGFYFSFFGIKVNKEKPKAIFSNIDTVACPGKSIGVPVWFKEGDSSGYNWQWFEKNTFGQWKFIIKRSGKHSDTLNYSVPITGFNLKELRIALNDNCSPLIDTAYIKLRPREKLKIGLSIKDTTLCFGRKLVIKANGNGGLPSGYKFEWFDRLNDSLISSSDTLAIIPHSKLDIIVRFYDNCMPDTIVDSAVVRLFDPINSDIFDNNAQLAIDTQICFGQILKYHAFYSGGKGMDYDLSWRLGSQLISNGDSIEIEMDKLNPDSSINRILRLTVNDNCTVSGDTSSINISRLASIKSNYEATDTVCFGKSGLYSIKGIGGNGNYNYKWWDSTSLLGTNDTLSIENIDKSSIGRKNIRILIRDGCSSPNDTIQIYSMFLAPLDVSVSLKDTCTSSSIVILPNSTGGKNYGYEYKYWEDGVYKGSFLDSQKVYPKGPYSDYKILLTDACSNNPDSVFFKAGMNPQPSLVADGFCKGDVTNFIFRMKYNADFEQFHWEFDNNPFANSDSVFSILTPNIGNHSMKISTRNLFCNDSLIFNYRIVEKPKAEFDYVHFERTFQGIPFYFVNRSQNYTSWQWKFDNNDTSLFRNPRHTFTDTGTGTVELIVSNDKLCFDTVIKKIPILEKIEFFFPSAFSPDNNNINDGFGLDKTQLALIKEYNIEIFNRWGERVFETDNPDELWFPEKAQQGLYIYKIKLRDIYNIYSEINGTLLILK